MSASGVVAVEPSEDVESRLTLVWPALSALQGLAFEGRVEGLGECVVRGNVVRYGSNADDMALGMGPSRRGAPVPADSEVEAEAGTFPQRTFHLLLDCGQLHGEHPLPERAEASVELTRPESHHGKAAAVVAHLAAGQVPGEAAHTVDRQGDTGGGLGTALRSESAVRFEGVAHEPPTGRLHAVLEAFGRQVAQGPVLRGIASARLSCHRRPRAYRPQTSCAR